MSSCHILRVLCILSIAIFCFQIRTLFANEFQVGVGIVDITPRDFDGRPLNSDPLYYPGEKFYDTHGDGIFNFLFLAGFRPVYPGIMGNRFAAGTHDPLWSRALAVQGSNGVMTVLISNDSAGISWKHINPVRRRIEKEFKIPANHIIITATHDHASPDSAGYWSTYLEGHGKEYTDKLREWMYQAAAQAISSIQPARMKTITTTHYSCYNTKTREIKKDPDCKIPESKDKYKGSSFDDYDVEIIQTDIRDPIVRNTRIVAAQFLSQKNETIATLINWHNHPDARGPHNMLVSSDFVHYTRDFVEKKIGGLAVYFSGTVGSQIGLAPPADALLWDENYERVYQDGVVDIHGNRVPKFISEVGWDKIRSIGYEIGSEVVTSLQKTTMDSDESSYVPVSIKTEPLDIQVDNFLHRLIMGSVWSFDVESEDQMRFDNRHCSIGQGCVRTDLSVIQIGELGIITVPGEMDPSYFLGRKESTADYGLFFGTKKYPAMPSLDVYMPGKHHAILGLANGFLTYLVPLSDNVGWWNFAHPNHYEEFITVGYEFGDDVGNKLMQLLESPVRYSNREILPKLPLLAEDKKTRVERFAPWRRKETHLPHRTSMILKLLEVFETDGK